MNEKRLLCTYSLIPPYLSGLSLTEELYIVLRWNVITQKVVIVYGDPRREEGNNTKTRSSMCNYACMSTVDATYLLLMVDCCLGLLRN